MNIPNLNPVESSNIQAIGYDSSAQRLFVQFKANGGTYAYENVPPDEYAALLAAPSIGAHFSKTIKSNPQKYPYTLI